MLRPEEITERIESKTKIKTWVETRMDGLRGLDEQSRCIGRLLLGYSPSGEAKIDEAQAPRRRACGAWQLRKLDEPALLRLGRTLFPQFPDVFEAAWKLHTRLPIQTDPLRKPFRAPDRPDLLRNRRIEFLQHLMDGLEGIDADLPWVAAHAPYLGIYVGLEHVGVLLAAAIDQGPRARSSRSSSPGTRRRTRRWSRHGTSRARASRTGRAPESGRGSARS